ncbi:unnamed protein product [Sphagnum jensenii]|uniref:DUF6821 domain-containing protein n=1 Tax=Sphagnum jensenii TaxID=128206 RepID=A0ABP0WQN6_9BRYO
MDQSSSHSISGNTSSTNRADENSRGSSSSEWEVVSLSLSSHSLAALASFDTDPVRGGIGDEEEAVDVGLQSNYFMYPSLSSSSEAEDIQPPIGSSDDDDGDGPSSLITKLDVDEEKFPVAAAAATTTSTSDNEAPDCLVKDKEDEEVQCLKTDRNLDSKFPGSDAAGTQKVELDERKGLEPLLGDGSCYEHTCEAWWKRRGVLLCVQAQQATTLWSLALAAAVMGLVILGHQWQQEWYQNQQLQLQLCSKDEKISHLTFQLAHLKEAMLGHRRVPVLRSSSR